MSKLIRAEIQEPTCHRIDFAKVKTTADVVNILRALEIIIYDDNDHWDHVKHLVNDDERHEK